MSELIADALLVGVLVIGLAWLVFVFWFALLEVFS